MRKKHPEGFVQLHVMITEPMKDYLDSVGNQKVSEYIRKLILADMNGHELELAKLREEKLHKEMELRQIDAQISQFEEESIKKHTASQTRQALIEAIADRMTDHTAVIDFKERRFKQVFQTNLDDANKYLSGSCDPIKPEEIRQLILVKAAERGVVICE